MLEKWIREIPDSYVSHYNYFSELWKENWVEIYYWSPYDYHLKNKYFAKVWDLINNEFHLVDKLVPDIVWYKSNEIHYIIQQISHEFSFVNKPELIMLCVNKYITAHVLKDISPRTFLLEQIIEKPELLEKYTWEELIIKPFDWVWGKWVMKIKKEEILKISDMLNPYDFVVQEFINSEKWIPWIVEWVFDLRVVFVWKEIIYSYIRTPKNGDFRCNISQWGGMFDVPVDKLPQGLLDTIQSMQSEVIRYPGIYSIDFTRSQWKYYLVELNSSPWMLFNEDEKEIQTRFYTALISFLKTYTIV